MWLTLSDAVRALKEGSIIAYPTEAVFGLGCDPTHAQAVALLNTLKARPSDKGWILIADRVEVLLPYIALSAVPAQRWQHIQAQWPGPYTWVFPEKNKENKKIAVRVTAHPVASALCRAFGKPIISTSANRGGASPLRDAEAVWTCFGEQLAGVLPGEVDRNANPTSIQDAVTGEVYRHA